MDVTIVAVYDADTKRTHRYLIESQHGITGAIYISKQAEVPKQVVVRFEVRRDSDGE